MDTTDIKQWIEQVLGEQTIKGELLEELRDGVRLCQVVDAIEPRLVRYKPSNMPFVQRENISSFLGACEKLGVPHHELFETVDLHEMNNPNQVCITIRSLSRHAHQKNPDIPVIGPKLTSPTQRRGGFKNSGSNIPAWNTRQYGYMEGASQGSQGVVFGGRRDIINRSDSTGSKTSPININLAKAPPTKPQKPLNLQNVIAKKPQGPRQMLDYDSDDDGKDDDDYGKKQPLMRSSEPTEPVEQFGYDEVYDEIKGPELKAQDTADKSSRYIERFKRAKEVREKDKLRAQDVKIRRDREQEGDEFEGEEEIVTSGYKAKRQELENARLEEEKQDRKGASSQTFLNTMWKQQSGEVELSGEEEEEVVVEDMSQEFSAGLNAGSSRKVSGKRDRHDESRDIERQIQETAAKREEQKRQRRQEILESLKSSNVKKSSVEAARERYLARKNNK